MAENDVVLEREHMRTIRILVTLLLICVSTIFAQTTSAQLSWEVHSYPLSGTFLQRADFNGDGAPDLMLYGQTIEPIFVRNLGDGTFDATSFFAQSDRVFDVQPGDFNRDGKIDFAGCSGNALEIIDGRGDGSFSLPRHFVLPCRSIAVADFNGDNKLDVAVVSSTQFASTFDNAVIIALGDGNGNFTKQIINNMVDFNSDYGYSCGFPDFNGLAVATDFNGDKKADLVLMMDCPQEGSGLAGSFIVGLGDGTGHFVFHKDQAFYFDANTARMRIGDYNQDSKPDVIVVAQAENDNGPFGEVNVFQNRGDGGFTYRPILCCHTPITAGAVADIDGNGSKDTASIVTDPVNQTSSLLVGGQSFSVPVAYTDMLWGDYDRDGRVDLAMVFPGRLDIWLNRTATAPTCPASPTPGSVKICVPSSSDNGVFHILANTNDTRLILATQIYVDGTLKLETPDDLINTNLKLGLGQHRITVKAWDSNGPFSSTKFVTVPNLCPNTTDRTVRICMPSGSTSANPIRILANAATSKPFTVLQIYLDGNIKVRDSAKYVDVNLLTVKGLHHITVKGWDTFGQFSKSVDITVPAAF